MNDIFTRFRNAGLKLNPKKCSFAKRSCVFLGHHISNEGIKPPPDRIKALEKYPFPKNVKQLRRVLGLFNWFKKFIPQYSAITQPMTKLLKKGSGFNWTTEQANALCELKHRLIDSPVLAFPRFDIPFYLAVDTSAKGIGYVLYQKHQRNDGTSENTPSCAFWFESSETLAKIVWTNQARDTWRWTSITDCSSYLRSHHFVVECDHAALRPLIQKQLKGAIYDRWLAILQQYNFQIRYKPAAQMQAPDALSRCKKSDATDCISSPNESDPYFPYVAEQTGINDIIAVNSSGEQIKQEMQLIHMSVIPNESDTDTGYTADTEVDSVLKVENDSIFTYHLANTEMCHLNSAFIQEEKIVSLQISDLM